MARHRHDEAATGPTANVRISRSAAEAVAPHCPHGCVSRVIGPELEAWIAEQYALALEELRHLEPAPNPRRGRRREVVTLRLPWWQVRRLGIIAEARDCWIGELVDDWLLAWAARRARSAPAAGPDAVAVELAFGS